MIIKTEESSEEESEELLSASQLLPASQLPLLQASRLYCRIVCWRRNWKSASLW